MKFKSIAFPKPQGGEVYTGRKLTVPDQSMGLKEILRRFVRNEAVAVGREGVYVESEDDLEKVAHFDLVEKEEFIERQKEKQKRYQAQEKKKDAERLEQIRKEEREKIRAEVVAEGSADKKP